MTEAEYISELRKGWPHKPTEEASLDTIALADEATRAFPASARLWIIRGDLIQLGPESTSHSLEDALASYQRVIELDAESAEAWESIGHYYDAVLDDESKARPYFQEAARLRRLGMA